MDQYKDNHIIFTIKGNIKFIQQFKDVKNAVCINLCDELDNIKGCISIPKLREILPYISRMSVKK